MPITHGRMRVLDRLPISISISSFVPLNASTIEGRKLAGDDKMAGSTGRKMNARQLEQMVTRLQAGEMLVSEFMSAVGPGLADLGDAQLDLDRRRRCGFPEVVFAEGKPAEALVRILRALHEADAVTAVFPQAAYNPLARTLRIPLHNAASDNPIAGRIAIVTAGTSDRPVAEEARETALWMGVEVTLVQDVGVAGPHRLPAHLAKLETADAIVVVAGMEGALPSVVGGYVAVPVIGVPTSVGYGASLGGMAALLSMLNSCAANVTVVNIDAGFKGGYVASMIARSAAKRELR